MRALLENKHLSMQQTHGLKVGGSIDVVPMEGFLRVGTIKSIHEDYKRIIVKAAVSSVKSVDSKIDIVMGMPTIRTVYEEIKEALNSDFDFSIKLDSIIDSSDSNINSVSIYKYRGNVISEDFENDYDWAFSIYVRHINSNAHSLELIWPGWVSPVFVRSITNPNILLAIREFFNQYIEDKHNKSYYENSSEWWESFRNDEVEAEDGSLVSLMPQETEGIIKKMFQILED